MTILRPLFFLTILSSAASATSTEAASPGPSMAPNTTDFIWTSCETTLYPELCYQILAGYSNKVERNPVLLARAAIDVNLTGAKEIASYVSYLFQQTEGGRTDSATAAALSDCSTCLGDAVDQIRRSLEQISNLSDSGEELRFQKSNVQTWMSAAITNEDTCMDGFSDLGDQPMKIDVCDRVGKEKKVTSIALALVNNIVGK